MKKGLVEVEELLEEVVDEEEETLKPSADEEESESLYSAQDTPYAAKEDAEDVCEDEDLADCYHTLVEAVEEEEEEEELESPGEIELDDPEYSQTARQKHFVNTYATLDDDCFFDEFERLDTYKIN